jgi:SAM-dependent methyltransferase
VTSSATGFAENTCSAPPERSDRMRDLVLAHVPSDRQIRILDIGCGTGSLLFRLADALPHASLVGIDLSDANIRAARREQAGRSPAAARIAFETADYLQYRADAFDAIVSDGVLHLVPGDSAALARKLADDLKAGGVLVCDMPFACGYNTAFAGLRRLLRRVRSPSLDRAILLVGRVLHGGEMSDDGLRERIGYMYVPPERVMGERLSRTFESAGLYPTAEYAMKSVSLSQLRHRVTVFERRAERR